MTAFVLPLGVVPTLTVKASGLMTAPLSSYADDGSADDAAIILRQIDNEIAARQAQLQLIRDRIEEIARQTVRQAEEAAERARAEVMASIEADVADLRQQIDAVSAEVDELIAASETWTEIEFDRRMSEHDATRAAGDPVPPPPM